MTTVNSSTIYPKSLKLNMTHTQMMISEWLFLFKYLKLFVAFTMSEKFIKEFAFNFARNLIRHTPKATKNPYEYEVRCTQLCPNSDE